MRSAGRPGHAGRPGGVVAAEVDDEVVQTHGVRRGELAIVEALGEDHVQHAQGQRRVRARTDAQDLVGLRGRLGVAHVHRDHVGAAPLRRGQMPAGIGLAREVRAPEDDEGRVGAHVLLGVGLEHAGEPQAESAQAPADHGGVPPLATPVIGEAAHEMRGDARAVVVGEGAVPAPDAHRLAAGVAHARGDEVERLVPRRLAPGRVAARAHKRVEQALGIADDLARGLAADAEKALAIGVVGVAPHRDGAGRPRPPRASRREWDGSSWGTSCG